MAFLIPRLRSIERIVWTGIVPVPSSPAVPKRMRWALSRTCSEDGPPTQHRTALANRLPVHQFGYRPVRWNAVSIPAQNVFPTWFAAIRHRFRFVFPSSWNSACFGYGL